MRKTKTYSELSQLKTFNERLEYLKLRGMVAHQTFGGARWLNQVLYQSREWRETCQRVIIRDNGCDLGIEGHEINTRALVHHLNPITKEDVINRAPCVFDLDNLITTTHKTHNAIHYGTDLPLDREPVERRPNDTCPWR